MLSGVSTLNSESTLGRLPRSEKMIDHMTKSGVIERLLEESPTMPGIVITGGGKFLNIASRGRFLQLLGRPFGRELFISRPIAEMLQNAQFNDLVLPATMTIHESAKLALARPISERYEPVAVEIGPGSWGVIDVATLLQAQSEILGEEINGHRVAVRQAQEAEEKFRGILENAIEGIFQATPTGEYLRVNPAIARIYGFESPEQMLAILPQHLDEIFVEIERRREFYRRVVAEEAVRGFEMRVRRRDGEMIWTSAQARTVRDGKGTPLYIEGAVEDITIRKTAEQEREQFQQRLMEASRHAGMAEVATGVLHNVGNVLNSVAVSTGVLAERLRKSKVENLGKAAMMLQDHRESLGEFLTADERGRALPGYLVKLSEFLARDQAGMVEEVDGLARSVEHIKEIVAAQQSFAKASAVIQELDLAELVEEAIRINAVSFDRHSIEVVRDFRPGIQFKGDKHLVMQILINLVSNAKRAVRDSGKSPRRVMLRICRENRADEEFVCVEVEDNGVGIAKENLTRIFSHGFTTREDGHGFGLHTSANCAQQMGGSLTAWSAGVGEGAVFTLELPVRCASEVASC